MDQEEKKEENKVEEFKEVRKKKSVDNEKFRRSAWVVALILAAIIIGLLF